MDNKSNEESNGLKEAIISSPHDNNESKYNILKVYHSLSGVEVDHSQNNNLKRSKFMIFLC